MARGQYRGVSGVARKVVQEYRGVNGVARRVTNAYRGISGIAREYFRSLPYWDFIASVYSSVSTLHSGYANVNSDGYLEMYVNCTNNTNTNSGGYASSTLIDNFISGETLTLTWINSSNTSANHHDKKIAFKDADGNYLNNPSTYGTVLETGASGSYTTKVPNGTASVSFILVDGRGGNVESVWIVNNLVIGNKTYI